MKVMKEKLLTRSEIASSSSTLNLKYIFLVSLGGMLELFDFTIYALLAVYLGQVFFPTQSNSAELLNTVLVFALGYCARPIGGVLFSHYGDRYGRKNAFQSSIFIMALSTLLVAFLPTYHQVGVLAPLFLISLRLLQGVSLGGEIPGASVFAFEHCKQKPGQAVGIIFTSLTFGNVIAILLTQFLVHFLSHDEMLSYGWRLAFILGSIIGILGFILRRKISETPDFSVYRKWLAQQTVKPVPLFDVFKQGFLPILSAGGLIALAAASLFLILSLPMYLAPLSKNINGDLVVLVIFMTLTICIFFTGALSDKINRTLLIVTGGIFSIIAVVGLFSAIHSENITMIWVYAVLFSITFSLFNGNYACAIVSSFPVAIRYTGTALSYNLGFSVFIGLAAFSQLFLLKYMPNTSAAICLFVAFSFISIFSALIGSRYQNIGQNRAVSKS